MAKKIDSPLTLHYKLFGADHVPDIVGTSGRAIVGVFFGGRLLEVLFFCSAISAFIFMVEFYLCAFWNILVFPDVVLMCQMMLKHLICLIFVSPLEVFL